MEQNDRFQAPKEDLKLKSDDIELKEVTEETSGVVPALSEFDLPHEFDGYEIEHLLGKGASGLVFKGRKVSGNSPVAIKVFKKELIPDKDALRRFEKEIELLKSISHPNIVSVLDHGTAPSGAPYMVMELIEGESIRDRLDAGIVFQPKTMATIIREVCRALNYTHEQSIIHRDLKPSNIIVNERNIAKVVDFGVAKAIDYTGETITRLGEFVGTPHYVSPEQCLGNPVDARSDIYSLGCNMFEMLTGIKALDAPTPIEAIAKLMSADRSHIEKTLESDVIPDEVRSIILKCLRHDPSERYQSIAELDHDLGAFLLNHPITFAKKEEKKRPKYNPMMVAIAAAVLILVLAQVPQFFMNWNQAVTPTPAATNSQTAIPAPTFADGRIVIKNRRTGKVIFSDLASDLKTALQHAADNRVSLAEADLRDAQLTQAKLTGLDLSKCDLSGAHLVQAQLTDVNFQGAQMVKVNLTQAKLAGCNLSGANLNEARLVQVKAPAANFKAANLSKADLTQARMERGNFIRARLIGTRAGQTHFENADMRDADFENAYLIQARFNDADVRNANFKEAKITQTKFTNARQY